MTLLHVGGGKVDTAVNENQGTSAGGQPGSGGTKEDEDN